ncbi:MAG: phosphocholine cytidylyltransferase family protein [Crocinitomicaceae bacterium]|nr:phosphocholine cytidylyltransferase family protein [Crocinitomicaceae bacterium]
MIGVVMAAGKGSRLGDLTTNKPKSLLELRQGFTLLDYNLDILESIGVNRIIIVTGFESNQIEVHTKNRKLQFVYNPFWAHCNVLGSLYMALPEINDDFLFLHADTLVDKAVWLRLAELKGDFILPYKKKSCGEEEMKIKVDENGRILEINKTMLGKDALGEFLGIAKFSGSVVNYFRLTAQRLFKNGSLHQYMEEVVQAAIDDMRNVDLLDIESASFVEVDFPEDYKLAKELFAQ